MKFNLNKGIAGFLAVSSLLPFLAFAEDVAPVSTTTPTPKIEKVDKVKTNFCTKLTTLNTKLADQITKAEEKQSVFQNERAGNIAKRESDTDIKRAISRSNADAKRVKNWDKMVSKAKTDVQKTAVATYKDAVGKAVDTRKTAVDLAVKTYRDGLTSAITNNSTGVNQAMTTFKASVATALTEAKTDCANNVLSKTVNANYTKKINDARTALNAARKNAGTNSAITALKKTRDEATKLAETTFKTATESARISLIAALK